MPEYTGVSRVFNKGNSVPHHVNSINYYCEKYTCVGIIEVSRGLTPERRVKS